MYNLKILTFITCLTSIILSTFRQMMQWDHGSTGYIFTHLLY